MAMLELPFDSPLWPTLVIGILSAILVVALYRITVHPLSKYPGPKLAGATGAYRAYYDIWKGGKMVGQLGKLHKQYGRSTQHS